MSGYRPPRPSVELALALIDINTRHGQGHITEILINAEASGGAAYRATTPADEKARRFRWDGRRVHFLGHSRKCAVLTKGTI